jgi:hypothetical protein
MRSAAASRGEWRQMPGQPITNALTIDVEDYFQVSALAPYIPRDQWDLRECRVERNVERILLMLDEQQTGRPFSRSAGSPNVIRISCAHCRCRSRTGKSRLRSSACQRSERSRFFCGRGTRQEAARRHLGSGSQGLPGAEFFDWRSESLGLSIVSPEAGYRYSSSIYPIRHDHYGMPDAPRFAHRVR